MSSSFNSLNGFVSKTANPRQRLQSTQTLRKLLSPNAPLTTNSMACARVNIAINHPLIPDRFELDTRNPEPPQLLRRRTRSKIVKANSVFKTIEEIRLGLLARFGCTNAIRRRSRLVGFQMDVRAMLPSRPFAPSPLSCSFFLLLVL